MSKNNNQSKVVSFSSDKHVYKRDLDLTDDNNSLVKVYNFVNPESKVLDVGCADGLLGKTLKDNKNCKVTGVDYNEDSIEIAKKTLDEAFILDVCDSKAIEKFGEARFNFIIFADLLEHLPDPLSVIKNFKKLLTPDGSIIISVPNVAHGSVRLELLNGNFDYTEEGLMDRTHLKFFTEKTLNEFLLEAGLFAVDLQSTGIGIVDYLKSQNKEVNEDQKFIENLENLPNATTLQFIWKTIPIQDKAHIDLLKKRVDNLEARSSGISLSEKEWINSPILDKFKDLESYIREIEPKILKLDSLIKNIESNNLKEELDNKISVLRADIERSVEYLSLWVKKNSQASEDLIALKSRVDRYVDLAPLRFMRKLRKRILGLQ